VRRLDPPKAKIVAQTGPFVRRQELLQPVRILRSPKGETILDFGQNMVGWVQIRVRGPRGTTITLRTPRCWTSRAICIPKIYAPQIRPRATP
jgi:Bacterial alpha-L-rhamnosidase.